MLVQARSARWSDALTASAILLLGVLSCTSGIGILERWQSSSARQQALHPENLLGTVAAAGGAALVGWWFLGFVLAAATALLERTGKTRAAAATRKLSPALMQRLVLGALSFQLVSGPAAHAGGKLPGPEWTPALGHVTSAPASAEPHTVERSWENSDVPPSDFTPGWHPAAPVTSPGLLAAPAVRATEDATPEGSPVTVRAGDTLWNIAAQSLGPEASDVDIAQHWPRWYEANRVLIGHNPNLLLPGQILQPPAA